MTAATLPPVTEKQLSSWKLLNRFNDLLKELGSAVAPSSRETHGLRKLDRRSYFGLFLLGLFNPVLDSMRGLCAASNLAKVQEVVGLEGPVGPSSFSGGQQVFAPEILEPILGRLVAEKLARQPGGIRHGRINRELIHIFDSTLWKVVRRMDWAEWREQHGIQRAVRLHLKLRLGDLAPAATLITPGNICERAAMRQMIKAGEFYLGDRNYGADYALFDELKARLCGFVLRLNNQAVYQIVESYPLSAAAVAGGIVLDAMVLLGHRGAGGLQRLVIKKTPQMKEELILVTSESPETLDALEVAGLYRHRWEIEKFFRWLKCLVPCRHWFAESAEGVTLQIHLCIIMGLLLAGRLGRKPNKRIKELLDFQQIGWTGDKELAARVAAEAATRDRLEKRKTE
jgi:hypothetical protein